MDIRLMARITLGTALLLGSVASAQTLYKLIDKNGKITYSESPPKDYDGQVIRIDIDPNANRATLPKLPADQLRPKEEFPPPQVLEARGRLVRAQRNLQEAREHPGEGDMQRIGNVGGGAREVMTEGYQQRLAQLEQEVKAAEEEVRRVEQKR
jgi:hypothetical protein